MDVVTKNTRSKIMRKITSKNTKFEQLFFNKLLEENVAGLCFHPSSIFGKPDIILKETKVAIFLDSCFWHGCSEHFRMPKSNKDYWKDKISKNRRRDELVNKTLMKNGWTVLRIWEHEISDETKSKNVIKKIKECTQHEVL